MAEGDALRQQLEESKVMLNDDGRKSGENTYREGIGNVKERLKEFVINYVCIFESFFSEYLDRLQNQTIKPGKVADVINKVSKTGKYVAGESVLPFRVLLSVIPNVASIVGNKFNRNKLKKLTNFLHKFKNDQSKVREVLVESGVEIFTAFESQFVRVTADKSWERAIFKLAHDAVNRVISYLRENNEGEFSAHLNVKGVLSGKSKTYRHTSNCLFHIKAGHSLLDENANPLNTAGCFDKVGLVTVNNDENEQKYYKKRKRRGSNTGQYGYRRRFMFETEEISLETDYCEESPKRKYVYTLKESVEEKTELRAVLLAAVNDQSDSRKQKLPTDFPEEMMQIIEDAGKAFNKLEGFIKSNFNELLNYIQDNSNKIEEGFSKLEAENRQGFSEIKDEIRQMDKKLDSIDNILKEGQRKEEAKEESIWFEVRKSSPSFTGRQKQLDNITADIGRGILVISGLPGVGKSELVAKYASDQYKRCYENVLWIDFTNEDKGKWSFHRLAKETKIKVKDEDGEDRSIGSIVKDIYRQFPDSKTLFIFDNVENYKEVKNILPCNLLPDVKKHNILITSQREWDQDGITVHKLENLAEDEATQFLKVFLSVQEQDTSQCESISKLARELHNFPLTLQQAAAYIRQRDKAVKKANDQKQFTVAEYISQYDRKTKELLEYEIRNSDYDRTTFTTFLITRDKIKLNEEVGSKAVEILDIMAYLSSDRISKQMLLSLVDGDESQLGSVILLLEEYLLVRNNKGDTISIHGLMQQVIRVLLEEQKEEVKVLEKVLGILNEQIEKRNSTEDQESHILTVWKSACKHYELVAKFIVDDVDAKKWKHFPRICGSCDSKTVETILTQINQKEGSKVLNKVINLRGDYKKTPLYYAAQGGKEETVKLLIRNRANVDTRDRINSSPLHISAKYGYLGIVRELLATNKVDINAVTNYRYTPLHLAAQNGHMEVVDALLETDRIMVDTVTKFKFTPLHFAAKESHLQIVKNLLNKSANPQALDNGHFTPLHLAAQQGHADVVQLLLPSSNINSKTTIGNTPLHLAAENGHLQVVEILLKADADVDITNQDNKRALDMAKGKNIDIARIIEIHK